MTLVKFIKENKQELDRIIQSIAPGSPRNNNERLLWIMNDEGLYDWAKSEGVKI